MSPWSFQEAFSDYVGSMRPQMQMHVLLPTPESIRAENYPTTNRKKTQIVTTRRWADLL